MTLLVKSLLVFAKSIVFSNVENGGLCVRYIDLESIAPYKDVRIYINPNKEAINVDLDDYYLLSHLRMEGKYFFKTKNDGINKHEHVIFDLDDGSELRYMDTRKFGKMYLIKKEDIDKIGPLVELGLEPWDDNLTSEYLLDKYKKKKLPIKSVLLDQNIIVGIGNIYADEILFLSKINPLKKCNLITKEEAENIIKYTKKVLEAAIEKGGTTIRTYSSVDGVHGLFQNELFVHGKDKNNCPICNTKIEKIKVGGRGTYYCPKCQTLQ